MADEVWPWEPDERVRLSSFNGIGFELKRFTRKDASADSVQYQSLGLNSNTLTKYRITGWSRFRAGEILRTYLFHWVIGPAVVLVPILLWLGHADQLSERIGIGWVIGVFAAWLIGSIAAVAFTLTIYRERWAPLRQAVIHEY